MDAREGAAFTLISADGDLPPELDGAVVELTRTGNWMVAAQVRIPGPAAP